VNVEDNAVDGPLQTAPEDIHHIVPPVHPALADGQGGGQQRTVGWIERDPEASFDSAQFLCTQPGLQADLSAFETPIPARAGPRTGA